MSCLNIRKNISKLSHKFRRALCLERKPRQRKIEISAPFDFKSGPKVNFPGFSESEISLMKEKAIASTAVSPSDEDATFDFPQKRESYPLSHARVTSSGGGSIRKRVIEHTRKISRGHFH